MALVGEATIKVNADTSNVRRQISNAFMSSGGMGKFTKDSEALSRSFHKAIRNSYKFQAAAGTLLQSIMALGGGLLALAGNLGGAAASGVALVGVMAQIKVASLVAKQAFKGIMAAVKKDSKNAAGATKTIKELREEMQQLAFAAERAALSEEAASLKLEKAREDLARVSNLPPDNRARREAQLAYSEAELAYRMAKDKNADAQDELLNPKKKRGGVGDDPYKDLTKSQKEFALYLKGIMPEFKKLNEAAAKGFLPEVKNGMEEMFRGGLFDRIVKGFEEVGNGLGRATKNFAGTMFDPQNQNNLSVLFKNTATTTATLGTVLGKAFSGFLTLMSAINPLVTRFVSFLQTKSINFAKNMQGDFANIQKFFKDAGDAAAGWGAILGRIFDKFKGMIKANIGPGTGGQMLLDFFNQGTTGFRNLDGAAGEFARKQHFLAAATNLKAMLESLGKIFGFLTDIGTDPAVASFWNILAQLEGPLEQIFNSIQGSSDELAHMLVSIVELVASFADSGQLQSYMSVVSNILQGLAAMINVIKPVLQQLGPLVGTIGGVIAAMLILKKVTMLAYGTFLIFRGAVVGVQAAMKAWMIVDKALTVQQALGTIAKKNNIAVTRLLTTAEVANLTNKKKLTALQALELKTGYKLVAKNVRVAATTNGVATSEAMSNRQMLVANIRRMMGIGVKSADAAANLALKGSMDAAIPSTVAFGVALNGAMLPILAVAAVIGVVALAIWGISAAIKGVDDANIKKATKGIDDSFAKTKGHTIGLADAQAQWNEALKSSFFPVTDAVTNVQDLGKALTKTSKVVQTSSTGDKQVIVEYAEGYDQAKKALDVYLTSLSKLAKKNLPEAQRQFRNMVVAGNLNREQTMEAILANKDMVKSLEKQAKALGDTIYNADGTVNALKAVDYAIGEGSYVRQKAIIEQKKFAETFKNAAESFIDTNKAMQDATSSNGKKFNIKKYVDDLKDQSKTLDLWRKNIAKLQGSMTNKALLQDLIAQGSSGAALVNELANDKSSLKAYEKAQDDANNAKKAADLYAKAYGDTAAVTAAFKKKFGGQSSLSNAFNDMVGKGAGAFELATKFNISQEDILAQQRVLDSGADLAKNVNISAMWDQKSLDDAKKKLDSTLGVQSWTITAAKNAGDPTNGGTKNPVSPKNGGYITRAMGGLVARFADGWGPSYNGRVSGPGTGRSDQIPAMISNGEFVVNARATASNLDLLNAINSGKSGGAGNQIAITVNAAPGMDEQQVAAQVARQLDAQLSRGGAL